MNPTYLASGASASATSISGSAGELKYVEFTSTVVVASVAEAAATQVVTAGSVTFTGVAVWVEFACPAMVAGGGISGGVNLWDGATDLGRMFDGTIVSPTVSGEDLPNMLRRRLVPTAGAHTYSIRMWNTTGSNFEAVAGAGGVGTAMPGYIRIVLA